MKDSSNLNLNVYCRKFPLLVACEKSEAEIVKILIDAGADVDKADVVRLRFIGCLEIFVYLICRDCSLESFLCWLLVRRGMLKF